jgi:hypothetical protein
MAGNLGAVAGAAVVAFAATNVDDLLVLFVYLSRVRAAAAAAAARERGAAVASSAGGSAASTATTPASGGAASAATGADGGGPPPGTSATAVSGVAAHAPSVESPASSSASQAGDAAAPTIAPAGPPAPSTPVDAAIDGTGDLEVREAASPVATANGAVRAAAGTGAAGRKLLRHVVMGHMAGFTLVSDAAPRGGGVRQVAFLVCSSRLSGLSPGCPLLSRHRQSAASIATQLATLLAALHPPARHSPPPRSADCRVHGGAGAGCGDPRALAGADWRGATGHWAVEGLAGCAAVVARWWVRRGA